MHFYPLSTERRVFTSFSSSYCVFIVLSSKLIRMSHVFSLIREKSGTILKDSRETLENYLQRIRPEAAFLVAADFVVVCTISGSICSSSNFSGCGRTQTISIWVNFNEIKHLIRNLSAQVIIKVGRLTLAIEQNEGACISAVHINWEFLLLKYEVNKNEQNFHLNNEEKLFT